MSLSFKIYEVLTKNVYNLRQCLWATSPIKYYVTYPIQMASVYFPKITYKNIHDDEYTKNSVKYNAIPVIGMITFTIIAANLKIASDQ
jgi:hypothetical protein